MYRNPIKLRPLSTLFGTHVPSLLNSSIRDLVQQGRYFEALQLYAKQSYFPLCTSKFTFPALLKACASLSNLGHGIAIHATIITMGFQFDPYTAASLINMYVKCGSLCNAVQVFENGTHSTAVAQDVTFWNSMIDGFFKNGLIKEGLFQFHRMQSSGVSPDGYSLCILLRALDSNFGVRSGKEIHGYVVRKSFLYDTFVITALIDMYSNFGWPMDAWNVFERLQDKNSSIVVWNAMINGFYENGWWNDSLELYTLVKNEGYKLVASTLSTALAACSHVRYLDFGGQVHADVIKVGCEDEQYVCTSLLSMYAKCGLVEDAAKTFNSVANKGVEIWNSMISAYVGNNTAYDALVMYHQMRSGAIPSDSFTISDILVACSVMGLYDFGRAIHAEIVKRPIQNNLAVQSSLLTMYSKSGSLVNALDVFGSMERKDVVAWGSIISGHSQNRRFKEALDLFKAMESDGMKADPDIMASVINSCVGLENIDLGCSIHGFVIKRRFELDAFVGGALVEFYSKWGQPRLVKTVFSDILNKNLVVWNSLISCYCQNGLLDLSISLLPEMMQHGLYPDPVSITTVLLAISSAVVLLKGKAIHTYKMRLQILHDIQMENALIDMYMKCGSFVYAEHVFHNTSTRNLVTWNTMISGYGSHGEFPKAINFFNEMRTSGISPDGVTFLSLISSCNHSGLVNEGLKLYELMREYRVEPGMEHYINMVDLLGRAGFLDDAYGFINNMHIEADESVWLCLLSACQVHRKIELGELAAQSLFKMDPTNGSYYIPLLNLYVDAGLQDKAANLRSSMRQRGLKKTPGCSWIEVKNQVDVFFSGDSSSRKTIQIYEALQSLRSNMKRTEDSLEVEDAV
ncbi:pentatricopeptide repeat-containing protein At2g40720-like isoform X1 [Coffea arabica]|uniref:Pentatricopeptide repeat-containing protein At2g40720-like isoform X1 n=1 Tax=Coffea arabica TaxID=13443 RepID=A0A6P6VN59_COFAR